MQINCCNSTFSWSYCMGKRIFQVKQLLFKHINEPSCHCITRIHSWVFVLGPPPSFWFQNLPKGYLQDKLFLSEILFNFKLSFVCSASGVNMINFMSVNKFLWKCRSHLQYALPFLYQHPMPLSS